MPRHLPLIVLVASLLWLCCAAAKTTAFLPEQGELFAQALGAIGLTPEDVRINDSDLGQWGGEKYRLRLHEFLYDNPWKTSAYTRSLSNGLLKNKENLGALVTAAHQRLDCGVRLGLTGDALTEEKARVEELRENALAVALSELTGMKPEYYSGIAPESTEPVQADEDAVDSSAEPLPAVEPAAPTDLQANYASLPLELKQAAALVLFAVKKAERYRKEGLVESILALGLDPQQVYTQVKNYVVSTFAEEDGLSGNEVVDDLDDVLLLESLMDSVDWNLINTGATLVAIATQEAQKMLTAEGVELGGEYSFAVETPLGMIELYDAGDDYFTTAAHLLAIDTCGDDFYHSAAGCPDFAHWASVSIDLAGDDVYANEDDHQATFGAGLFGYAVLLDAAGNDGYRTTYAGLGCGIFGTGIVYDLAGDEYYYSFSNSEASGAFGTGLLVDLSGNDYYETFKYGQGYGYTRGSGLLIDADGSDTYYANMTEHFNGGLYGPDHHVHFCQGSAFGRRGDFTDGHSWAGGFGLLLDGGVGNDSYVGDCYVQGNSYWYCVGMLVDKGGDDTYRCAQYSQASAPHFSAGILQDEAGDDHYTVTRRQSMGHGRDWSLAWFEDVAGNDWYQGARTTLGTSHVNSISVFWDRGGDDIYLAKGPSFGESELDLGGSPRDWLLTLGLFIDGGGSDLYLQLTGDPSYEGSDTYPGDVTDLTGLAPLNFTGDGKLWVKTAPGTDSPGYCGAGIDAP